MSLEERVTDLETQLAFQEWQLQRCFPGLEHRLKRVLGAAFESPSGNPATVFIAFRLPRPAKALKAMWV